MATTVPVFDPDKATSNIGTKLVSETDAIRVWHLHLTPGEILPPHRHNNPYFWTVLTDGKGRSRYDDGREVDIIYTAGDTTHFDLDGATGFIHDLQNTGESDLTFVTVEYKPQL